MAQSVTLAEVLPLALQLTPDEQVSLIAYLKAAPMVQPDRASTSRQAAQLLDRLREEIGPIDIPVEELIEEGRYR